MAQTVFTIYAEHLEKVTDKVDKANRRLAKNGLPLFSFTTSPAESDREEKGVEIPKLEVTLNVPEIKHDGWSFIATVIAEQGGTVIHCAPEQTLNGFRPENHRCDHCNINRYRTKSYILRHDDGTTMQIGSSCIQLFLGVEIKGLWLLEAFTQDELDEWNDERPASGNHSIYMFDVDKVLRLSMIASNYGKSFLSRSKAMEWETATADLVLFYLFPGNKSDNVAESESAHIAADAIDSTIIDEIIVSVMAMNDSEYRDNLVSILDSETVSYRSFGTLVSAVSVWARAKAIEAERKASPIVSGFIGNAKDKLDGIKATVTLLREIDGAYGTTTLIGFRTEDGHSVKWFASNAPAIALGDAVTLKGTVKGHETYNGIDSTLLTRCKLS